MPNDLRDLLNQHRWATRDLGWAHLTVVDRTAPDAQREVLGSDIEDITTNGVWLADATASSEGDAFLPYHRIIRVTLRGTTLYEKEQP